jgi:hypothetical protein
MNGRPRATLADYMVVGIAPALIMLLIGSLVFFLIGVFYQGSFPFRLTWVMGLFVMATVCVARISMEEGAGYAALFGLPLGVVVGIAVVYFVRIEGPLAVLSPLINWSMLGLIWFCAHKLTWDCTLIDDRQDNSGQGLLESMGWEAPLERAVESAAGTVREDNASSSTRGTHEVPTNPNPNPQPWWERWFRQKEQPATHGRWVVYFSVAALPLFGLGQYFIPVNDVGGRRFAFWMLVIYVGSALGLLLTTSFLGLRRYVRQRMLEMPVEMAAVWLGVGVAMILGLLAAAALLPRPGTEYSLAAAVESRLGRFASPDRTASRVGVGPDGAKANPDGSTAASSASKAEQPTDPSTTTDGGSPGGKDGKSGGDSSGDRQGPENRPGDDSSGASAANQGAQDSSSGGSGKKSGNSSNEGSSGEGSAGKSGQSSGEKPDESSQGNASKSEGEKSPSSATKSDQGSTNWQSSSPSESQSDGAPNKGTEGNQSDGQQGNANSPSSPSASPAPSPAQLLGQLGNLLRYAFYAGLALVAAFFAWKYREQLLAAWRQLLKELRELLDWLLGRKAVEEASAEVPAEQAAPIRRFADFTDPFMTGQARQQTLVQLVHYSFQALEAW